jgi:asparagine synthase (glutamine-hydrolysing)
MCGIAGQIAMTSETRVDVAEVASIVRRLVHRGPDDEGTFIDGDRRVALGIRRLAVIDLASGGQPVSDDTQSTVAVFNGEIYNFQELRQELERRGYAFRSKGDAEVIPNLYRDEGLRFLTKLRGMFALALWDARRETLILARDPIGKKPLYYCEAAGRLTFASEIEPLYRVQGLRRDIDTAAIDQYITWGYMPAPSTPFRSIRKFEAGEVLVIRRGHMQKWKYWTPTRRDVSGMATKDLVGLVRSTIEGSVRGRMTSDVPIGCFLSGGIDSSVVLATMARLSTAPIRTFSIGFSEAQYDELKFARLVARHVGSEHHEFIVKPDALDVLPEIVRHCGEPFGDSSAVALWYVARLARQHATVVLTGDGGDEVFAGYPWYQSAMRLNRLSRAHVGTLLSPWRRLRRGVPERVRRVEGRLRMSTAARFATLRAVADREEKQALYSTALTAVTACDTTARLADLYDAYDGDHVARMQYTDMATYLPEDLLVKLDRMSMAHSIEGRCPLLDTELIELGLSIPGPHKIDGAGGKAILREAMRHDLPPEILTRPKMGFTVPIAQWLRGELRESCVRKVMGASLLDHGWFQASAIERLLSDHLSGRRDRSAQLWSLLVLAEWAERYGP